LKRGGVGHIRLHGPDPIAKFGSSGRKPIGVTSGQGNVSTDVEQHASGREPNAGAAPDNENGLASERLW
jgi:hypothetical protein